MLSSVGRRFAAVQDTRWQPVGGAFAPAQSVPDNVS